MYITKASACTRCGRPLKDPKSVVNGMGPICAAYAEKEKGSLQKDGKGFKGHIVSGQATAGDDIILKRTKEGIPSVNLYQSKTYHSPDGFEWGFSGSGPADLALNILLIYLPYNKAFELHQDFKFQFIAGVAKEGGTIKGSDIKKYVEEKAKTLWD